MSRTGDCWDNAVAESFFATLKTELVDDAQWRSPSDGIEGLRQYLRWYNRQRLHSTLDYLSPVAYEARLTAAYLCPRNRDRSSDPDGIASLRSQ